MFKCQGSTASEHQASKKTRLPALSPHRSEGLGKRESLKMTGLELLQWSTNRLKEHQIENPRLNGELLLAYTLNVSREELYVRLHRELQEGENEALETLIQR